jgi:hypothetical protein
MNERQLALHWFLWGDVRAALVENQCMKPKDADAYRKVLYRKACGREMSMTRYREITNLQFDKIKAVFLAYIAPADLLAQMEQLDQPEKRKARAEAHARDLFAAVGGVIRPGEEFAAVIDRYIVRQVFGPEASWPLLTEQDAAVIVGILYRRKKALEKKAEKEGVPF